MNDRDNKINIQNVILGTLVGVGVLSMAVFAPNTLQLLRYLDGDKKKKQAPNFRFNRAFDNVIKNGYVSIKTVKGKKFVRITPKGRAKFQLLGRGLVAKMNQKWDQKWRLVIYDIKEKRKSTRDKIKFVLRNFGFAKLQNSVWIFPHDCEELIILLKADFRIGKDLLYLTVERLEGDGYLKKQFKLS